MKIRYTYDRVHFDCDTEGGTCENGFYNPCGRYAPIGADCPNREIEIYPIDTDWGDSHDITARAVPEWILNVLGSCDSVEVYGDKLTAYSADNCAGFGDDYHETRAAHLVGDPRLLRIIAHRLRS